MISQAGWGVNKVIYPPCLNCQNVLSPPPPLPSPFPPPGLSHLWMNWKTLHHSKTIQEHFSDLFSFPQSSEILCWEKAKLCFCALGTACCTWGWNVCLNRTGLPMMSEALSANSPTCKWALYDQKSDLNNLPMMTFIGTLDKERFSYTYAPQLSNLKMLPASSCL